jgi:hypothetical protein
MSRIPLFHGLVWSFNLSLLLLLVISGMDSGLTILEDTCSVSRYVTFTGIYHDRRLYSG